MGVFIAYAFSIRTMEPVDGRESGVGSGVPNCQLAAPTRTQTALLVVLAVMTVDFVVQELRQVGGAPVLCGRLAWSWEREHRSGRMEGVSRLPALRGCSHASRMLVAPDAP